MLRLSHILACLLLAAFVAVPALEGLDHHEEGLTAHHDNCGDCGCFCHAGLTAIVPVEVADIVLPAAATVIHDIQSNPDHILPSIDRPPKLFS